MTRQDYYLLAEALRDAYPKNATESESAVWSACCQQIAKALKGDNSGFKPALFLKETLPR